MGDLSPHFSRWEFRDHETGELVGPSSGLLAILERIRVDVGRPVEIVSGYRTPAHQERVNPGVRGYHPLGRAADLRPGVVTWRRARALGARGIGRCGKWAVHVDDRSVARAVVFRDC